MPHSEMSDFVLSCKNWPWIALHNSMQFALGVTEAALSKKAQFWIFSQCYRKYNSRELNLIENPIFGGLQNSVHKADGSKFMAHNNET